MVSVHNVTTINLNNKKNLPHYGAKQNVVQLNAADPNLLNNFLTLVGHNNKASISFKSTLPLALSRVNPYGNDSPEIKVGRPGVKWAVKDRILAESQNRINGNFKWPKIDKLNAWMISAETFNFMFVGGLAQVAIDLPNSLNNDTRNKNGDKMTIVTPLYTKGSILRLEEHEDGTYTYVTDRKSIDLKKIGKINVPSYDNWKDGYQNETEVDIFKGTFDGTEYIMLHTPKRDGAQYNPGVFDLKPHQNNNKDAVACYALNTRGIDELNRFAFFSKAVYELMKQSKQGKVEGIEAPNVAVLNDWHAGPVAALAHYVAPMEEAYGKLDKDTLKYFDNLPTVFIAHNLQHQGGTDDPERIKKVFSTLFGAYGADILENSKSWDMAQNGDKNALMKNGAYNSAKIGLSLVDRVVPVSENYGEELIKSNVKSNFMSDILKARKFGPGHTFVPITNGYSKTRLIPNEDHMKDLTKGIRTDFSFTPKTKKKFTDKELNIKPLLPYEDGNIENKIENKKIVLDAFRQLIQREKDIQSKPFDKLTKEENERRYLIKDPYDIEIPEDEDFEKTPLMVYCGRVDSQKGMDYIFKDAMEKLAHDLKDAPKDRNLPIILVGGTISSQSSYNKLKELKEDLKKINPALAKRFVLVRDFMNTHFVAAGADMFFVPSVFEPCGLTQMEAMAKGALPIATATGGLLNTVKDDVDGFVTRAFYDQEGWETKGRIYPENGIPAPFSSNKDAYCDAMKRALDKFYKNPEDFRKMQQQAMSNDFSWDKTGGPLDKYLSLLKTGSID